jgi:hypothetical protein
MVQAVVTVVLRGTRLRASGLDSTVVTNTRPWYAVDPSSAVRISLARAAVVRAYVIRACFSWSVVVVWAWIVRTGAGGRDQRKRAEQQADEDLRAQQVHPSTRTGRLHGLRHGADPRPGGGRLGGGQEPA